MTDKTPHKRNSSRMASIMLLLLLLTMSLSACGGGKNEEDKVQSQISLGDRYYSELDYDRAILAYEEALSIDPKNEEALIGAAESYRGRADAAVERGEEDDLESAKNDYLTAKSYYEQVLEIESEKEEAPSSSFLADLPGSSPAPAANTEPGQETKPAEGTTPAENTEPAENSEPAENTGENDAEGEVPSESRLDEILAILSDIEGQIGEIDPEYAGEYTVKDDRPANWAEGFRRKLEELDSSEEYDLSEKQFNMLEMYDSEGNAVPILFVSNADDPELFAWSEEEDLYDPSVTCMIMVFNPETREVEVLEFPEGTARCYAGDGVLELQYGPGIRPYESQYQGEPGQFIRHLQIYRLVPEESMYDLIGDGETEIFAERGDDGSVYFDRDEGRSTWNGEEIPKYGVSDKRLELLQSEIDDFYQKSLTSLKDTSTATNMNETVGVLMKYEEVLQNGTGQESLSQIAQAFVDKNPEPDMTKISVNKNEVMYYNGHSYYFLTVPHEYGSQMTDFWMGAAICKELGGHLGTITSEDEQEFVGTEYATSPMHEYVGTWYIMLGAYRESKSDPWKWVTGEEFTYTDDLPQDDPNDTREFIGTEWIAIQETSPYFAGSDYDGPFDNWHNYVREGASPYDSLLLLVEWDYEY